MALLDQDDLLAVSKTCKGLLGIASVHLYKCPTILSVARLVQLTTTVERNAHLASLVVDLRDVIISPREDVEFPIDVQNYIMRRLYHVCRNLKWLFADRFVHFHGLPHVIELHRLRFMRLSGYHLITIPPPNTWMHLTHLEVASLEHSFAMVARACPRVVQATIKTCPMTAAALRDALAIWTDLQSLTLQSCQVEFKGEGPVDSRALTRLDIDKDAGKFFSRCELQELHFRMDWRDGNIARRDPFAGLVYMDTTRLSSLTMAASGVPVSVPRILRQCPSLRELRLGPDVELDTTPVGNAVPHHGLKELSIHLINDAFESAFFAQLSGVLPGLGSCTFKTDFQPVVDTRPFFSTTKHLTLLSISLNPSSWLFCDLPPTLLRLKVDVNCNRPWTFRDAGQLHVRCPRLEYLALVQSEYPRDLVPSLVLGLGSLGELIVDRPTKPLTVKALRKMAKACPDLRMSRALFPRRVPDDLLPFVRSETDDDPGSSGEEAF